MNSPYINTRLRIIVARPGARGDFLAGLLGTLPDSVDTLWRIDVDTGRSLGLMTCFKHIDTEPVSSDCLNQVLATRNYQLDARAPWVFNMACHGYQLEHKISDASAVQIIQIVDDQHQEKINWEYTVKTWFARDRQEHNIRDNEFGQADRTAPNTTAQQRVDIVKQFSRSCARVNVDQALTGLDVVRFEYKRLFVPGGSRGVEKALGLNIANHYHVLWNTQLYFANSRSSYSEFDYKWTQKNYLI